MANDSKKAKTEGNVIRFPGPRKNLPLPPHPTQTFFSAEGPTFKGFHMAATAGDPAAAQIISLLLGIPLETGSQVAAFYRKKFEEDNSHVLRTMLLRSEVKTGLVNTVLVLLRECFGLEGQNALLAYNTLKAESLRESQ